MSNNQIAVYLMTLLGVALGTWIADWKFFLWITLLALIFILFEILMDVKVVSPESEGKDEI